MSGPFTVGQFCDCDYVTLKGDEALVGYGEKHLKDFPSSHAQSHAKGWGYYVSGTVKEEGFYEAAVSEVLIRAGLGAAERPPAGVEWCVREGNGGSVTQPGFGVAVIRLG